jgi:D-methionine transport system substrate-binding protein
VLNDHRRNPPRIRYRRRSRAWTTSNHEPGPVISGLEAAQLPRSLEDTTASVINGNYAIDAGLNPAKDALALESAVNNPNADGLVTRTELKSDPRITAPAELLQSQQVKDYIQQTFNGAVIPL